MYNRCYINYCATPIATVYKDPFTSEHVEKVFARGIGIAEITGDVIAEIDDEDDFVYYGVNHRGDTVATFDTSGSLTAQIWYDAFGNVVDSFGDLPFYTFSTKEYLADVDLYLYQYRVYDPIAGRWTQRDPINYQDSINLYQFCGNNPVNRVDVFGLTTNKVDVFISNSTKLTNSTTWSKYSFSKVRYFGQYKCNIFVYDMVKKAGLPDPKIKDEKSGDMRPPRAREWHDKKVDIPGWTLPHKDIKEGDVVSNGSHCGIRTKDGEVVSHSTKEGKVVKNDWGEDDVALVGRSPITKDETKDKKKD